MPLSRFALPRGSAHLLRVSLCPREDASALSTAATARCTPSPAHCEKLCDNCLPVPHLQRQARISYRPNAAHSHAEGDVVLLRDKKDTSNDGLLIKLQSSKTTGTHRGSIKHADVIGKEPRQIVNSSRGSSYRVHEPTLAEYVRLTPRLVTPVRPSYVNLHGKNSLLTEKRFTLQTRI